MQLTFLGGADEVGASSTLIEIAGKRVLVDAGIRISPRSNRGIQNSQLPDLQVVSAAGGPDYILVTHAHTDHTGALPLVVERYPVPVIATKPTVALVRTLQADAQRIMQSRKEQEGEIPLFDEIAVDRLMSAFQPVDFNRPVRLGAGLQVTYHPAGHILGAAMVILESDEGTLVLSGDVSRAAQRAVIAPPSPRIKADAFVVESTYGGRLHANRVAEEKRLVETLAQAVERGGRVLVPAFAIGRAQEIIQIILAFRDKIDASVYVDGMVRQVCRTYAAHADWLPPETVQAAGDDALFFRSKVHEVRSAAEREDIARAEGPAVIVASSGMLTGGASVVYARHLAGDERNAILLTGYQDEESPGRFLQNAKRRRDAGEAVTLRLEGETVTLRCAVDTYSLSAHADEAELVGLAEALEADDVLLVHGDPGARHSLGARLRERGKRVRAPIVGQAHALVYAPRLVAVGQVAHGSRAEPLDPAALWEALKDRAGDHFTAGELAKLWWGDPARAAEAVTVLTGDRLYFAPDWRQHDTYKVRTPEEIAGVRRQRAIMAAHPDLVGQVIVLRDRRDRPCVGVVLNAGAEGFEAFVRNSKERTYPAGALLWPVGRYIGSPAEERVMATLTWLLRTAQSYQDRLLPPAQRDALVAAGAPVNPAGLVPASLPDDIRGQPALLAVVWGLVEGGAELVLDEAGAVQGLLPQPVQREAALEMNQAREAALAALPAEARLRKVGLEVAHNRMILNFDFPDQAAEMYAGQIAQLEEQTGWEVVVNPQVNQQALGAALEELLPPGAWVTKGPGFHLDRRLVQVEIDGLDDFKALAAAYRELTGFELAITRRGAPAAVTEPAAAPSGAGDRLEVNAAYTLLRAALEPFGLYKTSLKQEQIVLSFISPQVGARHREIIAQLAEETGYPLVIHPHPNQQKIMQIVNQVARGAGWQVVKGPSLHVGRGEVSLKLAAEPESVLASTLAAQVEEETGYRLVIEAP